MADLATLIAKMQSDGTFAQVTANPLAQFGTATRRYVGAELLPERLVEENAYREANIRYRTVIANSGTRFSPAQKKGGANLVGDMLVELGNSDIARELDGREYDALLKLTQRGEDMAAMEKLISWADINVNRALIELCEQQRWQALVDGEVVRHGQNGYDETITYPVASGHSAGEGGSWASDAYDPFDDILAMHRLLASKGFQTSRIITSTNVVATLAANAKVAARTGSLQVVGGNVVSVGGFASLNSINGIMQSNGLPVIETYDLQYRDEDGSLTRFLPDDVMIFTSQTGQDEPIAFENPQRIVPNILGYTAIGRPVGMPSAGRAFDARLHTDKPPRLSAEGWQESLPVITEPESFAVVTDITLVS